MVNVRAGGNVWLFRVARGPEMISRNVVVRRLRWVVLGYLVAVRLWCDVCAGRLAIG